MELRYLDQSVAYRRHARRGSIRARTSPARPPC